VLHYIARVRIVTEVLARRLVDSQFPEWADLPLTVVDPGGSDHTIYRLGAELSVRFPRHEGAIGQAVKEMEWLPRLAPHLPLAIPAPVGVGRAGFGYPWSWAVSRWLPGSVATVAELGSSVAAALELAEFLRALQGIPIGDQDLAGRPLSSRDQRIRSDIAEVAGVFDAAAMTAVWEEALAAPPWDRTPVWYHGDFHTGNLLTVGRRLSAVIDFGGLGVGDPACDLMMAFTLMDRAPRAAFRSALSVDDATWARGRGLSLAAGLSAYTAYAATDPRVRAATTRQITAALAT
jgi:aminoglycoside phosphotransferase (APT) family kinase protein